ncbi:recombinase RecT, partial [Salmonella enterica subsp. enterica serovar Typhimurium]|uniref:recombinase RecT n=1 Tax=Salmonella enterica TaxID=28901 RepID=UPI000CB5B131
KFSKTGFNWKDHYDAMAKKTVRRNMLNKWGILSIDMQKAYSEDVKDPEEASNDVQVTEDGDVIDANFTEVQDQ